MENVPYIHFTDIPSNCDRRKLQQYFSEFGTITKLYLSPTNEFGKVYFNNMDSTQAAYQEIKDKKFLNLTASLYIPPVPSENDSVGSDKSLPNMRRYKKCHNNNMKNTVETSVTQEYVDIFGRIVTTLQDDSGDLYVSLNELKKSGFELFERASLPNRNSSRFYNSQKLEQFKLYMKMKAAKFMSRFQFEVPEYEVNGTIENETSNYFNLEDNVAANSTMKMTSFNYKKELNDKDKLCIKKGSQPHRYSPKLNPANNDSSHIPSLLNLDFSGALFPQQKHGVRRNDQNQGNKTFSDFNNKSHSHTNLENHVDITSLRRPALKREVINDIKPLVRVSLELNKNIEVNVVHVETHKIGWVQLSANETLMKNLLDDTAAECKNAKPIQPGISIICGGLFSEIWCRVIVLSTSPLKVQYIDYGNENTESLETVYQLSNKLCSIPAQAVRINLQENSNVNLRLDMDLSICPISQEGDGTYVAAILQSKDTNSTTPSSGKQSSTAMQTKTCLSNTEPPLKKPLSESNKPNISKPQEKSKVRKIVIEELCENGIFEFGQTTGTATFTGFALPESCAEDCTTLEEITMDCQADPLFKPKISDLVAAHNDGDYVRGIVLSISNQLYTCAFIDYGIIKVVEEIRPLPDKYISIPEFSFECRADPKVIQEIETAKTGSLQIKSPGLLNLTLESGKMYKMEGSRWDPLKSNCLIKNESENSDIVLEPSTSRKSENDLNKSEPKSTSQRKLVIEAMSENGMFEIATLINDTTFIGFAFPASFEDEINALDGIAADSQSDPLFTPVRGDLVAAYGPDGFVRGIVLSKSNEWYKCALIDYGTIKVVKEVRMLPAKYVHIPEFAFECNADSKIVQDIQAHKCVDLKIVSPYVLNLTLESGQQCKVKGHHWDPLKFSNHANDNKTSEKIAEPPKSTKSDIKLNQTVPSPTSNNLTNKTRKLVIEDVCESGVFEFIENVNDTTFIGFAWPDTFTKEFGVLENITDDTHSDPSFAPTRGDLVAAHTPDGFARGIVLNVVSGKYKCALIDYGTIKVVKEVRMLPAKYVDIPEFAFECIADSKIVQDIQAHDCVGLKIVSPYVLNLTLDSGQQCEMKGHRWDPLKFSNHANDNKTSEKIAEPPRSTKSDIKLNQTVPSPTSNNLTNKTQSKCALQRKLVIEDVCDSGVFEFIENISDTTFIGFAWPDTFTKEFGDLEKITDDTHSDPSFAPTKGDLVAAHTPDGFARGIVLNIVNGKFDCALIDYGTVKSVNEVRSLPSKYSTIPEFTFECSADSTIVEDIKTNVCKLMLIKSPRVLTLQMESGKEYEIKGYRWDPLKNVDVIATDKTNHATKTTNRPTETTNRLTEKTNHTNDKTVEKIKQPIYNVRPCERNLKDQDQIIIVAARDDFLFVRNKECNSLFKIICQELEDFNGEFFEKPPQVGYLAVCNFNDDSLYRVIIKSINSDVATVEYIDFGDIESVPLKDLKTIGEKLALMDNTLIKIYLKDFVGIHFKAEILKMLIDCSEKKEKFVAHKVSDGKNVYDVIGANKISLTEKFKGLNRNTSTAPIKPKEEKSNSSNMPEKLETKPVCTPIKPKEEKPNSSNMPEKLETKPVRTPIKPKEEKSNSSNMPEKLEKKPVCTLTDITKPNINLGMSLMLCMFTGYLNEGTVSFCKADEETLELLDHVTETVRKYVEMNHVPYHPELLEICLAKFEDDWCRAAVLKSDDNDSYGVFFIDFGNTSEVSSRDIRKLPEDLSKIRGLAMLCKIEGVIKKNDDLVKEPLLSRLIQDISENEVYNVNLISNTNNEFIISIPSLLEGWKKDRLF